jgi:uncharacterized protein with GYD domain
MNHYLLQGGYTTGAWEAMIRNPQNRGEMIRSAVRQLGGDVVASWMCDGAYDVVVILQLPDDVTGLAIAMAVKGGGGLRQLEVTRLFSWGEAMQAMDTAARSTYRPPAPPIAEPTEGV